MCTHTLPYHYENSFRERNYKNLTAKSSESSSITVPISFINIVDESFSGWNVRIQYKSPQAIKENTKTLAMHCLGRRFMNLSSLTLNEFFILSPKSIKFE